MIGFTNLEAYFSIFYITEGNNKFELYSTKVDEFSFTESKDELQEIPNVPNFTPKKLQDEKKGPRKSSANEELKTEKGLTDGYITLLMCYDRPPFREFESFLRIVVGLDEDDIQLIFKQNS